MQENILQLTPEQAEYAEAIDGALKAIQLKVQLKSGIDAHILGLADWEVFSEVVVREIYDLPIRDMISRACNSPSRVFQVLDLGANAGFFSLRLCDLWIQAKLPLQRLRITAVEANPSVANDMATRFASIKDFVRVIPGAVGAKSGVLSITNYPLHNFNSTHGYDGAMFSKHTMRTDIPYVDLNPFVGSAEIDLMKCDIEGSELEFLRNYPEIISRTHSCVMELHPHFCDQSACLLAIGQSGLKLDKVLEGNLDQNNSLPLVYFQRKSED